LHLLRDLGFGRKALEEMVSEEMRDLCTFLDTFDGQPVVNVGKELTISVVAALWRVIASEAPKRGDKAIEDLQALIHMFEATLFTLN